MSDSLSSNLAQRPTSVCCRGLMPKSTHIIFFSHLHPVPRCSYHSFTTGLPAIRNLTPGSLQTPDLGSWLRVTFGLSLTRSLCAGPQRLYHCLAIIVTALGPKKLDIYKWDEIDIGHIRQSSPKHKSSKGWRKVGERVGQCFLWSFFGVDDCGLIQKPRCLCHDLHGYKPMWPYRWLWMW